MLDSPDRTEIPMKSAWARSVRTLVHVLIIGGIAVLLLALILPFPFRRGGYKGDVNTLNEINHLSQALMLFKATFGEHPPSSIHLYEKAAMWRTDVLSRQKIRRLWPQFDFDKDIDLNSDGDNDDVHELTGAECLVFFLGGISQHNKQPVGFSKNPALPFDHEASNRVGPFIEFDTKRLTDVDADGFHEYCDPIRGMPFLYVSRGRSRYRNLDLAIYPAGDVRNMTQVYQRAGSNISDFQIISAGRDGEYGVGGMYSEHSDGYSGNRTAERDNLTSFYPGRLDQF